MTLREKHRGSSFNEYLESVLTKEEIEEIEKEAIKEIREMKLREKQWLFMQNVAKLIAEIDRLGYTASFGEVWRTPEQASLNAAKGIGITNSLHLDRLAVDINLFKDGVYITDDTGHKELGAYWKSLHKENKWGGDWAKKDYNHYQMDR